MEPLTVPSRRRVSKSESHIGGRKQSEGKRHSLRLVGIVALAIAGGAGISYGLNLLVNRTSAPPPLSVVFPSASDIRELQWMAKDDPKNPEWHARLGMAFLNDGHYLSAINAFNTAIAKGEPPTPVRRPLAICLTKLERFDKALAEYQKLALAYPNDLWPRLEIAQSQSDLGKPEEALKTLDTIPLDSAGFPTLTDPDGRLGAAERLAVSYGKLEQWKRTLEISLKVLAESPNRTGARIGAAKALFTLQRPAEAVSYLEGDLGEFGKAPDVQYLQAVVLSARGRKADKDRIQRLLEAAAGSGVAPGDTFVRLGHLYEEKGQWEKAGAAFSRANDVRTQSVASLRRAYPNYVRAGNWEEGIYKKGLYLETLQRYPEAVETYRELTKKHSCCQSGYMHMARAQRRMGDTKAAVKTLLKALSRPGAPSKVYSDLAGAYSALQLRDKETAMWKEFIKRDPANADLGYQNLGNMADVEGKIDEAETYYRKSIEVAPNADLYYVRLAKLLLQRRSDPERLAEAVRHLERAIKLAPDYGEAYFQLGVAYRYSGRNEDAIAAFRHAIDLDPGEGKSYQPLGETLIAAGHKEQGKEALAQSRRYREFFQAWETLKARVNRSPNDVNAQRRLAAFYERTGAAFDAINAYAEVVALDPSDQKARRRMKELYAQMGQGDEDVRQAGVSAMRPEDSAGDGK